MIANWDTIESDCPPTFLSESHELKWDVVDNLSPDGPGESSVQLWDYPGCLDERWMQNHAGAHVVLVAFDLTRRDTLESVQDIWSHELPLDGARILVGTKSDLVTDRQCNDEEVMQVGLPSVCS